MREDKLVNSNLFIYMYVWARRETDIIINYIIGQTDPFSSGRLSHLYIM